MGFSALNTVDVIDVVLYRYNYYDNKIWTGVKNQMDVIEINDQSVLVSPYYLKKYVEKTYPSELNRFKSIGSEFLHKDANSIYFINSILSNMSKLKWIKLTLDKTKRYSRLVVDPNGGEKRINFSYKILHATIKLYEIFDDEESLASITKVLTELDLLEPGIPYQRNDLSTITYKLDNWMNEASFEQEDDVEPVATLLDMLDPKFEGDNPEILLVTDY
jgi:hypothetical protein